MWSWQGCRLHSPSIPFHPSPSTLPYLLHLQVIPLDIFPSILSCDVRIFPRRTYYLSRTYRYGVRVLLTMCVGDRRTSSTYAFTDVRHSAAYVLSRSGVGTTQSRSGFGTTDLMKKIPLAHSGLRLAPKIYD